MKEDTSRKPLELKEDTAHSDVIIDLQGFRSDDNKFIVKELAAVTFANTLLSHFVFKTPPRLRNNSKSNIYLTRNLHNLRWTDGDVPYEALHGILERIISLSNRIFVKGLEKKRWLQEFADKTIIDLGGLPSLKFIGSTQRCHLNHNHCALGHVVQLRKLMLLEDDICELVS